MKVNDWNKLTKEQKSYNLRLWIFNRVKDHELMPHNAMQLDEAALSHKDNNEQFTNFAFNCGFLTKN